MSRSSEQPKASGMIEVVIPTANRRRDWESGVQGEFNESERIEVSGRQLEQLQAAAERYKQDGKTSKYTRATLLLKFSDGSTQEVKIHVIALEHETQFRTPSKFSPGPSEPVFRITRLEYERIAKREGEWRVNSKLVQNQREESAPNSDEDPPRNSTEGEIGLV